MIRGYRGKGLLSCAKAALTPALFPDLYVANIARSVSLGRSPCRFFILFFKLQNVVMGVQGTPATRFPERGAPAHGTDAGHELGMVRYGFGGLW